ncbi:hypothetical protein DTO207G8_8399 [Paecilomyces variotii]|nr:hypothetical protein DTO207G8_8399 [Paecilomyces variotii]KAJ9378654.1 hypothetical protein DTO063F5_7632 [Paecilomyces variotii]
MSRPSDDAKVEGFFVPSSPNELAEILKKGKMENVSLYHLHGQVIGSGSKVSETQFVAFRAVWPIIKTADQFVDDTYLYGIDKFWEHAKSIVNNLDSFKRFNDMLDHQIYLKDLAITDQRYPSIFATLKDFHEIIGYDTYQLRRSNRVKRAPPATQSGQSSRTGAFKKARNMALASTRDILHTRTSKVRAERPAIEQQASPADSNKQLKAPDEATVNAAIIAFLRLFSGLVRTSKFEFLFERVSLTPTFGKCSFTAYTDGAFQSSQKVLAIIEVKKTPRIKDLQSIQMQETAKMVGWLRQFEIDQKFMNNQYGDIL